MKKLFIRKPDDNSANFMKRLLAYTIDWYIVALLCNIPVVYVFSIITKQETSRTDLYQLEIVPAAIALTVGLLFTLAYLVIYQSKKGATVGKKIFGIKVVREDGQPLDMKTMFFREFIGIILIEGALLNASINLRQFMFMITSTKENVYVQYIFWIICVISILVAVFKPERKMIHDYLAKTRVVAMVK